MQNASGAKNVTCGRCNKRFHTKQDLRSHSSRVHGNQQSGPFNSKANNMGNPRTNKLNYDGTLRRPNQANEEALYGSTAVNGSIQRTLKTNSGIQEAVAGIMGTTPEGRAWALAALHPCGAGEVVARNIGVVNGMCDTMTSAVATPVYRSENHISYSPVLFDSAIPSPSTYGIDIIVPPIPELDFCYRLIDDSTQQTTGWIAVRLPKYELPKPRDTTLGYSSYNASDSFTTFSSVGYGKVRQIAIGHTFELDAAGLNDQGRVVVGQMEGQWRAMPLSVPAFTSTTKPYITSVDFSAQTTQDAPAVVDITVNAPQASSNVWYLEIPTDPSVITSSCPNAYQGLAKYGAYVVQKFTSPLLGYAFKRTGSESVFQTDSETVIATADPWPFVPTSAFAIESRKLGSTLATADAFWAKDDTLPQWSAFGDGILPVSVPTTAGQTEFVSQTALHPGVSEPSDMMTAVIMFRNLPAGGMSGITSSVRVKSRNYYEAISNGLNPAVAPYVHPPAQFDFQALNSVIIAGKQLADGYPASANSLSTILNKVWGALKQYVRPIASTVGTFDLPVVSGIAKMIDRGIQLGTEHEGQF